MNKKITVGLIGFGKTGKAVATVLLESPLVELRWILRRSRKMLNRSAVDFLGVQSEDPALIFSTQEVSAKDILESDPVEMIIDFSGDDGLNFYGIDAARNGVNIISAVSQYSARQKKALVTLSEQTAILYSPNITIGINFLMLAAKILKKIAPYTDIEIIEEHFKLKPEVSGTAKVIANQLDISLGEIKTIRAGGIIGVHEILFGFPYQTVRLRHESISREAFGNGVLFAMENLRSKSAGLYTMEQLLQPYFESGDLATA
jgi:4-hydroxy-tetrahydrodipicolinate reductase